MKIPYVLSLVVLALAIACTRTKSSAPGETYEAVVKKELATSYASLPDRDPIKMPALVAAVVPGKFNIDTTSWGSIDDKTGGDLKVREIPRTSQVIEGEVKKTYKGLLTTMSYAQYAIPVKTDGNVLSIRDMSETFRGHKISFETDSAGNATNFKGLSEILKAVAEKYKDPDVNYDLSISLSPELLKLNSAARPNKGLDGKSMYVGDVTPDHSEVGPAILDGKFTFTGWAKGVNGKLAVFDYTGLITIKDQPGQNPTRAFSRSYFDTGANRYVRIITLRYIEISPLANVTQKYFSKGDYLAL